MREKAKIGTDCIIGKGVYIDTEARVGNFCKIQNYACIYRGVSLGEGVFVGPHATFTNDLHPRAKSSDWKVVETAVEDGASIGANATIICGIKIGKHAMIGSGAVVTKNVPPQALVYGNPASVKGYVCECGNRLAKGKKTGKCTECKV